MSEFQLAESVGDVASLVEWLVSMRIVWFIMEMVERYLRGVLLQRLDDGILSGGHLVGGREVGW